MEELIIIMSVSKKIKAINNEIEQRKARYDLDKQTARTSVLSSINASKYEFLKGKYLNRKRLFRKRR